MGTDGRPRAAAILPRASSGERSAARRLRPDAALVARVCGGAVVAVGTVSIVGWAFGVHTLDRVSPSTVSLKANTAVALMLCGVGVLSLTTARLPRALAVAAGVVAPVLALLVGGLTLAEYALGRGLGIDQLLFGEAARAPQTGSPGRMAVATAVGIVLGAASILLLRARRTRAGQVVAAALLAIGLSALLGYAYGVPLAHPWNTTNVAPQTIGALVLLALGLLATRPGEGSVGALLDDTPAGLLGRRVLTAAFVALPLLGGLRQLGEDAGLYGQRTGVAIMVLASLAVLTVVVALTGARLNALDRQRAAGLERLADSERRLRRTLDHLVRARDTERRRLAMEIHDDTLPALSAVRLQLELARDGGSAGRLDLADRELREAGQRLRSLIFDVRPDTLVREGLGAALRHRLDRLRQLNGIAYELHDRLGGVVSAEAEAILYRAGLEALNNVAQHARAEQVRVEADRRDGAIELVVRDDGVGMADEGVRRHGMGLVTMAERAQLAGGGFELHSEPGRGTTVVCWVPLEPQMPAEALT